MTLSPQQASYLRELRNAETVLSEASARIAHALDVLGVTRYMPKDPSPLQRVAVARILRDLADYLDN